MSNPFGSQITADDIVDTLTFLDDWEMRYAQIIDLGKQLPPMDDALKTEANLVRGCQSQVWLVMRKIDNRFVIDVDSDALIVRGLAAIVLAAFNNKTAADILAFDIESYFNKLDLLKHISPIRGNGIRAMVERIRTTASTSEGS